MPCRAQTVDTYFTKRDEKSTDIDHNDMSCKINVTLRLICHCACAVLSRYSKTKIIFGQCHDCWFGDKRCSR